MGGAEGSRSRRLIILCLLVAAALCGILAYFFKGGRPPKEEMLVKTFYAHRVAYEHLREMLLADEDVRAVYARFGVETTKSGLPRPPSEVNFPVSRYNEYLVLLNDIGSTEVFRGKEDNSEICIAVWASGFGGDTRHINNCWLEHTPVNQVATLEEFYRTPKSRRSVFRHIDGNWYLWADW